MNPAEAVKHSFGLLEAKILIYSSQVP